MPRLLVPHLPGPPRLLGTPQHAPQDDDRGVSEWKEELNEYGSHFAEAGNKDAAIFVYTLYQMACNKLPTESLNLKVPSVSLLQD